jgi:hypothetical protein
MTTPLSPDRAALHIAIEGRFDLAAAHALRTLLRGEHVVVDFSRARDVDDVALAHLVSISGEIELHGLPVHSERLLRYLGATSGTAAREDDSSEGEEGASRAR